MGGKKKIVIVGGGFGGVYTFLNLSRALAKTADLTLISKQNYFLFTPLLHEVATGSVNQSNITQPLRQIFRPDLGRIIVDEAVFINPAEKIIKTLNSEFKYDFLVLAAGAHTKNENFTFVETYELKTLADARKLKNQIIECFEKAETENDKKAKNRLLTFIVIGGGPTGVELAAEIAEFAGETLRQSFCNIKSETVKIYLLQRGGKLLAQFDPVLASKAQNMLSKKLHMEIRLNSEVVSVNQAGVILKDGSMLETATPILTAGVAPTQFEFTEHIQKNNTGQILTNSFLQVSNFPNIFVVGDMAAINCDKNSIPQTAQAAEAGAKIIAQNITALLRGRPLISFVYKERGQLVSLGRWMAIAEIYRFKLFGHFAWWVWRTIYAAKLIGWTNRLRVVLDWTIDIFYPRDISKF